MFGLSDYLKRLSAIGDPPEELGRIVDFVGFRPTPEHALAYSEGAKGGRSPYDCVAMINILILAAQNNVADAQKQYLIRDRLSWLNFLGFHLGAPTPDANTIRLFRERLTEAKAITVLFDAFDNRLRINGYLALGGQIVDATLVAAPYQRKIQEEKDAFKTGKTADEVWPDKPARGQCHKFRVWAGIMGKKETYYVTTQRACDSGRDIGSTIGGDGCCRCSGSGRLA